MIIEAFRSALVADAGISSITTAIYPHHIPQAVNPPALTYSVDDQSEDQTLSGASSLKTGLFSVECWDYSVLTAHSLADAVESALIGVVGDFGGLSPSQTVDHIRKERRFDLYESDTRLYRVSLQFFVAYY